VAARRDWTVCGLGALSLLVAAALLLFVDFAAGPRVESSGDSAVVQSGCLDWWCRARDVVPAAIAFALLIVGMFSVVWGLRRRGPPEA